MEGEIDAGNVVVMNLSITKTVIPHPNWKWRSALCSSGQGSSLA